MRLGRGREAARKRGRIRKPRLLALALVLFALSAAAFSYGLVTAIRSGETEITSFSSAAKEILGARPI